MLRLKGYNLKRVQGLGSRIARQMHRKVRRRSLTEGSMTSACSPDGVQEGLVRV